MFSINILIIKRYKLTFLKNIMMFFIVILISNIFVVGHFFLERNLIQESLEENPYEIELWSETELSVSKLKEKLTDWENPFPQFVDDELFFAIYSLSINETIYDVGVILNDYKYMSKSLISIYVNEDKLKDKFNVVQYLPSNLDMLLLETDMNGLSNDFAFNERKMIGYSSNIGIENIYTINDANEIIIDISIELKYFLVTNNNIADSDMNSKIFQANALQSNYYIIFQQIVILLTITSILFSYWVFKMSSKWLLTNLEELNSQLKNRGINQDGEKMLFYKIPILISIIFILIYSIVSYFILRNFNGNIFYKLYFINIVLIWMINFRNTRNEYYHILGNKDNNVFISFILNFILLLLLLIITQITLKGLMSFFVVNLINIILQLSIYFVVLIGFGQFFFNFTDGRINKLDISNQLNMVLKINFMNKKDLVFLTQILITLFWIQLLILNVIFSINSYDIRSNYLDNSYDVKLEMNIQYSNLEKFNSIDNVKNITSFSKYNYNYLGVSVEIFYINFSSIIKNHIDILEFFDLTKDDLNPNAALVSENLMVDLKLQNNDEIPIIYKASNTTTKLKKITSVKDFPFVVNTNDNFIIVDFSNDLDLPDFPINYVFLNMVNITNTQQTLSQIKNEIGDFVIISDKPKLDIFKIIIFSLIVIIIITCISEYIIVSKYKSSYQPNLITLFQRGMSHNSLKRNSNLFTISYQIIISLLSYLFSILTIKYTIKDFIFGNFITPSIFFILPIFILIMIIISFNYLNMQKSEYYNKNV